MKPILVVCIGLTAAICSAHAQAISNWPDGRMAISSDGNAHDKDDIGGTPMSNAILFAFHASAHELRMVTHPATQRMERIRIDVPGGGLSPVTNSPTEPAVFFRLNDQ